MSNIINGFVIMHTPEEPMPYQVYETEDDGDDYTVYTQNPVMYADSVHELMERFAQLSLAFIEGIKTEEEVFGTTKKETKNG